MEKKIPLLMEPPSKDKSSVEYINTAPKLSTMMVITKIRLSVLKTSPNLSELAISPRLIWFS